MLFTGRVRVRGRHMANVRQTRRSDCSAQVLRELSRLNTTTSAIATVNLRALPGVTQLPALSRKAGVFVGSAQSPSISNIMGPITAIEYGLDAVRSMTAGFEAVWRATSLTLLEFFWDGGLKISASAWSLTSC
eukprot:COSAG02_NODE_918_length_15945_cov_5.640752_10_plen_133_part_00